MTDRSMPSVPQKTLQEKAAKLAHRREKAISELCDTETTYCTLLGLLIQYFVRPLSDYRLITDVEHATLFPQLLIIKNLSDKFLADLTERRQNWDQDKTKLSDLFEEFTPFFKMYQGYVNGHEKAVNLMRVMEQKEKWVEYRRVVRKDCQGFDLSSLLILPIQRIPRYKLLLNEIVKNTSERHPDYNALSVALSKVQSVSLEINDRMNEFERRETVKQIELSFKQNIKLLAPHRQFLKQGKLYKVCRNKDRLYHFFLFNDMLLYASEYGSKYSLHNQLPIDATFNVQWIDNAGKYGEEKNGRIFQIISAKKSFVVYAESDKEKEGKMWFDVIAQALVDQQSKQNMHHHKQESTSAAIWVPDMHKNNCTLCNGKFTFVTRRHHCRRCGNLVCSKCSKWKLPNAEGVQQRACRRCYFQMNENASGSATTANTNGAGAGAGGGGAGGGHEEDDDSSEDEYEKENEALNNIPYYIDMHTSGKLSTEDLFNKFGHGVGSYLLVPADQNENSTSTSTSTSNNAPATTTTNGGGSGSSYYKVTLVVYTQTGFEQFPILLFSKKNAITYRLDSPLLKRKDFNDMSSLIGYIEKKRKLIFSYAIPRSEVHNESQSKINSWTNVSNNYSNNSPNIKGLENYPKARALFDYEAEVLGDLTLRTGDFVYIVDREDGNGWWTGVIDDRTGLFPSTYVEIIDEKPLPSIHKNEPREGDILIARFNYYDGGQEELRFSINDRIILQAKDESGWWLGQLEKTNVVGWFAPDLVVPADQELLDETPPQVVVPSTTPLNSNATATTTTTNTTTNTSASTTAAGAPASAPTNRGGNASAKTANTNSYRNGGHNNNNHNSSTKSVKKPSNNSSTKPTTNKYKSNHNNNNRRVDDQKEASSSGGGGGHKSSSNKSKTSAQSRKASAKTANTDTKPNLKPQKKSKSRSKTKSKINDSNSSGSTSITKPKAPSSQRKKTKHKKSNVASSSNAGGGSGGGGGGGGSEPANVFSYQALQNKSTLPDSVDKSKLEVYLSNAEFYEVFKCTRQAFVKKPAWKKKGLKKSVGLF